MTLPASIAARVVVSRDRAGWLAARGIGGSDVAAIRGRSPFGTAWDVWVDRQSGVEHVERDADILAEGHRFEPMIASEYTAATGRAVERHPHLVVRHAEFPWASGSPDGFVVVDHGDVTGRRYGGIELKTYRLRDATWGASGTVIEQYSAEADEVVAPYYLDQVYWYLEVTGLPWWDVAVWLPRSWGFPELRWFRVMADRPHQRRMLLEVARWRQRHLVEGVQPVVDDSRAARQFLDRAGARKRPVRDATEAEGDLVARLHWARSLKAEAERECRQIEAELAERFGSETYGVRIPGLKCLRIRGRSRGEVNLDLVRAKCPEAVTEGREFFRFNLYPVKE